jgi:hypothetical protein
MSDYDWDANNARVQAEREAREQAESDRLAAALGAAWNPVRPADVRSWDTVSVPKYKKDYTGKFIRCFDVPRQSYAGGANHDPVPDYAVMQVRSRQTGLNADGSASLFCDWYCPCCGSKHEKVMSESLIDEGGITFLTPREPYCCEETSFFYLAAPYTHPDPEVRQQRWLDATHAAAWLMQQGHRVLSPISMGHPMSVMGAGGDWGTWHAQCLAMLEATGAMCILQQDNNGWRQSIGIQAEAEHARKLGRPIWSLVPTKNGYDLGMLAEQRWW